MTRAEQQASDKRYQDWREVYVSEIRDRVKHWGDRRRNAAPAPKTRLESTGVFAPGGDDV